MTCTCFTKHIVGKHGADAGWHTGKCQLHRIRDAVSTFKVMQAATNVVELMLAKNKDLVANLTTEEYAEYIRETNEYTSRNKA